MRRTAIFPSLLKFGGVCVCRSTSSLISARAERSRLFDSISLGDLAANRASQAEMTSNLDVRLAIRAYQCLRGALREKHSRAFINDTASLIAFLVCALKARSMFGNGCFHFNVAPKSPCVPITHK